MKHARRTTGLYNTPMSLTTDIRSYQPFNQQEASDREVILRQLEADPRVFQRDSLAHMTCSIWTVDPAKQRTLMVYHVASPDDPLRVKPDENSGVRWMDLDEALAASTEPWMRDRIYRKLVDKLAAVDLEMRR